MRLKQRQKIIGAVTLLAFLSFFLPTYFAHASIWDSLTPTGLITTLLQSVFTGINGLTAVLANALSLAVVVRAGGDISVVATTWTILRDFANMFFIIMLIYMAFATIFDQGKYTFKDMIVRFVIVAVLINFSLVIGNLVIDFCQVLSNIFLGSIGNLGNRLGSLLNPALLFNAGSSPGSIDFGTAGLTSLIFAIILSLIFLFSILVATVFSIVRVPIIWGLLIVSPIAWMSYVLPGTNKWFKQWWSLFFGWNLFLPVYLFFMYLGLLFLAQRDQIMGAVIQANSGVNPTSIGLIDGLNKNLTFNLLFFYLFAAFVMIGGTWAAKATTSALGGTGFDKGLGWAKWTVKNFPTPIGSLTNWQEATKMRREQFKKEGVLGYFGTEKSDRQTSRIAGGVFGVRDATQGQLSKDVGLWKDKLKNLSPNEWRNMMTNTGTPMHQRLAAAELLREIGQLSSSELVATYKLYGGDRSGGARKFLTDVDFGKLSEEERKAIFDDKDIKDIRVRQKLATVMAEKGDIGDSAELVRLAKELYGPSNELGWREFLEKSKKKKLLVYAEAMTKMNLASQEVQQNPDGSDFKGSDGKTVKLFNPDGSKKLKSLERFITEQTIKMKVEDFKEQDLKTWNNDDFKKALLRRLDEAQDNDPRKKNRKGTKFAPGAGERILKDLKNRMKEDPAKMAVLRDIEGKINVSKSVDEDEAYFGGGIEPETTTPPTATGTSYNMKTGVPNANVIDLRNNRDIEIK